MAKTVTFDKGVSFELAVNEKTGELVIWMECTHNSRRILLLQTFDRDAATAFMGRIDRVNTEMQRVWSDIDTEMEARDNGSNVIDFLAWKEKNLKKS